MHPVIENFLERPTSHKIGFWVGSVVFLSFVLWTYLYGPKAEELTKLTEEVDSLESQITQETRIAKNKDKFLKEVKELDVQFEEALLKLPDKREIPDLLSSISSLARDAGLDVQLFKPRAENFKDFYAEVPVEVSVEGTYHQVATFFDEVGKLDRIVNINQIFVRDPKVHDDTVDVKTDCLATTFRYLDDQERQANKNKTESAKKRRK